MVAWPPAAAAAAVHHALIAHGSVSNTKSLQMQ
jgi:hypothetical protein